MRWSPPWMQHRFGAVEVPTSPTLYLRFVSLDRKQLEDKETGFLTRFQLNLDKRGIPWTPGAFHADDVRPMSLREQQMYRFPEEMIGAQLTTRELVLPQPRMDLMRAINAAKLGLMRIEVRGIVDKRLVTYIFGYDDGEPRLVIDYRSGTVRAVPKERLEDYVKHMVGAYDPSR